MKTKKERKRKASSRKNSQESQNESQEENTTIVSPSQCVNEDGKIVPKFGKKQKLSSEGKENVKTPEELNEMDTTEIQQSEINQKEDIDPISEVVNLEITEELTDKEIGRFDMDVKDGRNVLSEISEDRYTINRMGEGGKGDVPSEIIQEETIERISEINKGQGVISEVSEEISTRNMMFKSTTETCVLSEISEDNNKDIIMSQGHIKPKVLPKNLDDKDNTNKMLEQFENNATQMCQSEADVDSVENLLQTDKCLDMNSSSQRDQTCNTESSEINGKSDIKSPKDGKCSILLGQNLDLKTVEISGVLIDTEKHVNTSGVPIDNEDHVNNSALPIDTEEHMNKSGVSIDTEEHINKSGVQIDTQEHINKSGVPMDTEEHGNEPGVPIATEEQVNKSGVPMDTEKHVNKSGVPMNTEEHKNTSGVPIDTEEHHITYVPIDTEEHIKKSGVPIDTEEHVKKSSIPIDTEEHLIRSYAPINTEGHVNTSWCADESRKDIDRKQQDIYSQKDTGKTGQDNRHNKLENQVKDKDLTIVSKGCVLKETKVLSGENEDFNDSIVIDEIENRKEKAKSESKHKNDITTNFWLDESTAKNIVANDESYLVVKSNRENVTVDEIENQHVISPGKKMDDEVSHFEQTQVFLPLEAKQHDKAPVSKVNAGGDNKRPLRSEHASNLPDFNTKDTDDITDSQLCSIDWMDGFSVPEKYQRKMVTQSQDGTNIIKGLIKELSQLNTMILRAKRELETARRQLHQGQPLGQRGGQQQSMFQHSDWNNQHNRMGQNRNFNRH